MGALLLLSGLPLKGENGSPVGDEEAAGVCDVGRAGAEPGADAGADAEYDAGDQSLAGPAAEKACPGRYSAAGTLAASALDPLGP